MASSWKDSVLHPLVVVVLGLGAAGLLAIAGVLSTAVVVLVVTPAIAWYTVVLRQGKRVTHQQALSRAAENDLIVYWKPGCTFCVKLRAQLGSDERNEIFWVNTAGDEDAAAYVAGLQDGDVLTPTAVTGGGRPLKGREQRHATVKAVRSYFASVA